MAQRSLVDCFSQEIIDKILDNFRPEPNLRRYENGHIAALQACSVVCRAFTPRSQYHIFSSLALNGWGYEDDRERRDDIYNLMLVKPHLISGVRHVLLKLGAKGMKSVVNQDDITQPGLLLSLRECQIKSILILSDLGADEDNGDAEDEDDGDDGDDGDEDGDGDDGDDGDEDEADDDDEEEEEEEEDNGNSMTYPNPGDIEKYFIQPFIQSAFVTSLDFSFTVIRTSILACFPNLAELALLCSGFEPPVDNDYEKIVAPIPRAQLRKLKTSTRHHIEDILRICGPDVLPLFDLSRLRILKTYPGYDDEDTMILGRALDICAESLEELELIGGFKNTDDTWPVYNLGRFSKLNILHLSLKIKLQEDPGACSNLFIDHCRLLATISSPNTMKKIDLKIEIDAPETLSPLRSFEAPGWDELDHEFQRMASGKALEVNLIIKWTVIRRPVVVDHKDVLQAQTLRTKLEEILRTTFIHATRQKFQRVGQNSKILFEITIDCCYVFNIPSS